MSRNGSGTYTAPSNTWNPATTGTTVSSADWNTLLTDLETAISNSIAKDGQTTITANLPMATYKHTGVGDATARDQYASMGQLQDNKGRYLTSVSGTDTIAATASFSMTAYATGQSFVFIAAGTNTGAVTLNVNTIGAKAIQKNGQALVAGDITANDMVAVEYDGTQFQMISPARTPVLTDSSIPTAKLSQKTGSDTNVVTGTAGTASNFIMWNGDGDAVDSTKAASDFATAAQGTLAGTSIQPSTMADPLNRPVLSNNATDADHDIDITAGARLASDGSKTLKLTAALTKQIDASWASGDNAGGLSSSLTLSADTWYHVFLIEVAGAVDVGFDTSVTAANLVTDHSATAYRRIGSILTNGSSNITAFSQYGNKFRFDSLQADVSAAAQGSASRDTRTISTPLGIVVEAEMSIQFSCPSSSNYGILVTDLVNETDSAVSLTNATMYIGGNGAYQQGDMVLCNTNTSSQIGVRATGAGGTVNIATRGWMDAEI